MLESGTDPESYITEYTLVYEHYWHIVRTTATIRARLESGVCFAPEEATPWHTR